MVYMGISFGLHIIILVCLILASGFNGCDRRSLDARVIDVDLVSLPVAADSGGDHQAGRTDRSEFEETSPPPVKKAVSISPRKATPMETSRPVEKVKTSLKEKTFSPGDSVENAIARLEKRVDEKTSTDSLDKALSRLRQAEQESRQSVTVSGGGGGVSGGRPGGRSAKELEAIEIYKLEIRYHILRNWVFSSQLARTEDPLKAVIGITIAADGRITDTWFDRRSGNDYFDNSAYKAVLKSNPLPKLPEGFKDYTVGLAFTPSDLR